jgi:hypothetical protein
VRGFPGLHRQARAGRRAGSSPETWKAIVKAYVSPEYCDHTEFGCPLAALAPEFAGGDTSMRNEILSELTGIGCFRLCRDGERPKKSERSFRSTMIGAMEIARMLPEPVREKVLQSSSRTSPARFLIFRVAISPTFWHLMHRGIPTLMRFSPRSIAMNAAV